MKQSKASNLPHYIRGQWTSLTTVILKAEQTNDCLRAFYSTFVLLASVKIKHFSSARSTIKFSFFKIDFK